MSDTAKSRTSPASKLFSQIRKRASTLRQQAINASFVSPQAYRRRHEQGVPTIFGSRESSTFYLKAINLPRLRGRRLLRAVAEAPRFRRLQQLLIILTPTSIDGRARSRLCFKSSLCAYEQFKVNNITRTVCYMSQRAPEMVPTRPAAP